MLVNAACAACPAGSMHGGRAHGCRPCPAGSRAAHSAADDCECGPGFAVLVVGGAAARAACAAGTYKPGFGNRPCLACPAGAVGRARELGAARPRTRARRARPTSTASTRRRAGRARRTARPPSARDCRASRRCSGGTPCRGRRYKAAHSSGLLERHVPRGKWRNGGRTQVATEHRDSVHTCACASGTVPPLPPSHPILPSTRGCGWGRQAPAAAVGGPGTRCGRYSVFSRSERASVDAGVVDDAARGCSADASTAVTESLWAGPNQCLSCISQDHNIKCPGAIQTPPSPKTDFHRGCQQHHQELRPRVCGLFAIVTSVGGLFQLVCHSGFQTQPCRTRGRLAHSL
jgi:hypothetical protein